MPRLDTWLGRHLSSIAHTAASLEMPQGSRRHFDCLDADK